VTAFVAAMMGAAGAAGIAGCIHSSTELTSFSQQRCGFESGFNSALPGGSDYAGHQGRGDRFSLRPTPDRAEQSSILRTQRPSRGMPFNFG